MLFSVASELRWRFYLFASTAIDVLGGMTELLRPRRRVWHETSELSVPAAHVLSFIASEVLSLDFAHAQQPQLSASM